jgi:hypothetical protein
VTPPAPRRSTGILLAALVLLLFVVELVALATGRLTLAAACGALLVGAWFVLRSWQRGRERR